MVFGVLVSWYMDFIVADNDTVTVADADTNIAVFTGVLVDDTVIGQFFRCGLIAETEPWVFPYVWDL